MQNHQQKNQYNKDFVLTLSLTYIEDVRVNVGSAPSQSEGTPGVSENVVNGDHYRPLLQAAFTGDWESAEKIFLRHPSSKLANITSRSETALHIAALNAQDQFVENLIELLSQSLEELEKVDCGGRTALHHAVLCGRIRIVEALVRSNRRLTQIQDKEGCLPFNLSTQEASMHKEIAWFLAKNTTFDGPTHPDSSPNAIQCIVGLAYAGHLDIILYLLGQYPSLILRKGPGETGKSLLGVLARMQSHFLSGTRLSVWEALIYKCIPVDMNYKPTDETSTNVQTSTNLALQCLTRSLWNAANIVVPSIKRIHDVKWRHEAAVELVKIVCNALSERNPTEITQFFQDRDLLAQATVKGISELVKLSIQYFPELIWISPYGTTLMTLAVQYRQERILRLFLKESSTNGLSLVPTPTEIESGKMMRAAAKCNPDIDDVTNVSGAAFQMQREIQWFKAVESWVTPDMRTARSGPDNKTYWQMFVEKHQKLLENGQKWVKETADKCMLVSTLIATVLFAAVFTVPGTNIDSNDFPLKGSVLVFAISDGLGLLCSMTAILLFLAILTSRDEPLDFFDSLPKKIIMGLSSLFLSLAFMLVAFAAALRFVLDKTLEWVVIPIALLTSLPVALFIVLQLPLLFQMVRSTYGPSIFRAEGIRK
ncbi:uncharacterized protein LOC115691246 [Syzygium oleosum]|uniref:uncharacterized protein LOC115691246 n=1 Tax=Syzygium oleosum TaxID=219896 RepID=UPI0024BBC04D|nr:uncharacterized protein LOC115691246 [Syzygium oleosum]